MQQTVEYRTEEFDGARYSVRDGLQAKLDELAAKGWKLHSFTAYQNGQKVVAVFWRERMPSIREGYAG